MFVSLLQRRLTDPADSYWSQTPTRRTGFGRKQDGDLALFGCGKRTFSLRMLIFAAPITGRFRVSQE